MHKSWDNTLFCYIWIFNVERGICAFIRTPLNQGILVDCGSSSDFSPINFIKSNIVPKLDRYLDNKLAQVVISHPHIDHFSDIDDHFSNTNKSILYPSLLTCPHDKDTSESLNWKRVQNLKGSESLIKQYKSNYEKRSLPLQTILFKSNRTVPNLEYGIFYLSPPVCEAIHPKDDLQYVNSTSILLFLRYGDHTILFPGDMTPEGMKCILNETNGLEKRYTVFDSSFSEDSNWHRETSNQPSLKKLLSEYSLTVLVAPHHGLESGYSQDLYDAMADKKPGIVVISEKRYLNAQDGLICQKYQTKDGASGLKVNIEGKEETKYSLSTKGGHHTLMVSPGTGQPKIYMEKDPFKLLEK